MKEKSFEAAEETHTPTKRNCIKRLSKGTFFVACFSFATYLAALAYEGFFARFIADDFCYVNPTLRLGLFRGFLSIYNNWSGRFSAIFITQLGSVSGYLFPSILPILLIIGLLISLNFFYWQLLLLFGAAEKKRVAILPALVSLFFFLLMTPDRYQVLDWVNGSVTYSAPLIVMLALITWLIRIIRLPDLKKPWLNGIGIFLLAFMGAGFSETNTALLISALLFLCLLSIVFIKKEKKWQAIRWQLVALTGSVSGLVMMVLAPGNEVRKTALNLAPPKISELVLTSMRYTWDFIIDTLKTKPLPTLILVSIFFLAGFLYFQEENKHSNFKIRMSDMLALVLIPIIGFILLLSVVSPSVYFLSAYPADRALSGAMFIFVISLSFTGLWIGNLLKGPAAKLAQRWQKALTVCFLLVLLLLSIYPIRAKLVNIPEIQKTIRFGRAWDARHAMIKTAVREGQLELVVPDINSQHGLQDVDSDPTLWVNQCMAEYYGLISIRTGK